MPWLYTCWSVNAAGGASGDSSRSCSGFLTISATMVCMMATLPFKAPPTKRASKATQYVLAIPKTMLLKATPARPMRATGLRP